MTVRRIVHIDPGELEREEFTVRATELHSMVAWAHGRLSRASFRRWLRSERWPAEDLDVLVAVLEHVFATEARMPAPAGLRAPVHHDGGTE